MRFYEISSGVRIPIDAEQQHILDLTVENGTVRASELPEREAEVARLMVSRGLLLVDGDEEGPSYRPNDAHDLWRL